MTLDIKPRQCCIVKVNINLQHKLNPKAPYSLRKYANVHTGHLMKAMEYIEN